MRIRERAPAAPPELRLLLDGERRSRGPDARLIVPRAPERGVVVVLLRVGAASLALVLLLGILLGLAFAGEMDPVAPEIAIHGPGRLAPGEVRALLGSPPVTDAVTVRSRLLSTGLLAEVVAEGSAFGRLRVRATEKRAVALVDADPPLALAADGTVLGRATAADLDWSEATDLPVVQGVFAADGTASRSGSWAPPEAGGALRLASRLAGELRRRPRLDRLVSEIRVDRGPLEVIAVTRPGGLEVLLTRDRFLAGLEVVAGVLPALTARWPDLAGIDARAPDRLFLTEAQPAPAETRPDEQGGSQP